MIFSLVVGKFDLFSLAGFCLYVLSELFYLSLDFDPFDVDFIVQHIELIIPDSRHILLLDYSLLCILSEFIVGWFIFETLQGSSHAVLEIL
jgi:hypothetical protein